jgi:HPt (histidine-containing phosphotransfer) domain-containing protein
VSDQPVIDQEAISNLKELNPGDGGEFLREIVSIYVEDTPKRIAELKAALASKDVPAFTRAAHTIKGSSANVGASSVRALAERLEFMSKRDGLGSVGPLIANVEAEFAKAAAELGRISAA